MKKIPTNIITGFLGVGKTTAILALLNNKPTDESWAVLVNEFGEIGIDGTLMSEQGALIKEVPGGCICCAAGIPMSVAITALLRQQPTRLLIEPTGLGHPKQVIATLLSEQYQPYVDLMATIALVDPRYLSDEKYINNQNFIEQLACAEVVIANKVDQCCAEDIDIFNDWVTEQQPPKILTKLVTNGALTLEMLDIPRTSLKSSDIAAHHHHHAALEPQFELAPGQAYLRRENSSRGKDKEQDYFSCGWLFGAEYCFDFDLLFSMLTDLTAERVKAVVNTNQGCYAFNVVNQVVSVTEMSLDGFESRFEVIDAQLLPWDDLESILLSLCGLR